MFRKTIFALIIALTLMVNSTEISKAGFFDDSIDFSKAAVAARWECDISNYYKAKSCTIAHEHNTYGNCEFDQGHHVSESWQNKPSNIIVEGSADYEGDGYVRFSATGGQITLNGGVYQKLTSRTTAGKRVGSTPSLKEEGSNKKKPRYTLVKGSGTVRNTVYELVPPTSIGHYTLTVNSGNALGDGFEASGGAYVEVSTTAGITEFSVTGTYGVTVEWSKGREVTSTGILSNIWNWQVSEKAVCNSHNPPQEIMNLHDHHWTCPTDNNGCGEHIQCGVPSSNIPDEHELHATCWNSEHGCTEADVRKCTHECEHDEPEICETCDEEVETALEHFKKCGSEVPGATAGCGVKYWTCLSSSHDVLMCGRWNSNSTDICGMLYRACTNPQGECLYRWNQQQRHINGVEVCVEGCFGSSCYGCDFDE